MSTTAPASARNITVTAKHAKSVDRLAWQLGKSPERLIARILELGILTIDNELSQGCEPLAANLIDDFNCTNAMDAMTFDQIAETVKTTGKDCQEVLYERHLAKKRRQRRRRKLVTEAANIIPFYSLPRIAI